MERRPQRPTAARHDGPARRGGGRRRARAATSCGTSPSGSTPTSAPVPARGGVPDPRRAPAAGPGHRPARAPRAPPASPTTSAPSARRRAVEGLRGTWRVDPAYLEDLDAFEGRTALLSPLDRLVFDRKRMEELFEFDYQLEMYKPAAKRRWGYWALPVLHGDALVGKVDATADRDAGRAARRRRPRGRPVEPGAARARWTTRSPRWAAGWAWSSSAERSARTTGRAARRTGWPGPSSLAGTPLRITSGRAARVHLHRDLPGPARGVLVGRPWRPAAVPSPGQQPPRRAGASCPPTRR